MAGTGGRHGMIYALGAQAQRVYITLRTRIHDGVYAPGVQLPPHTVLATEFGVAPLTVRNALAQLEQDGLISREHGRGTFVRAHTIPAILIVEDDPAERSLLAAHVLRSGYRAVEAATVPAALAVLVDDRTIALVLSDVRMPNPEDGVTFIRTVRQRWSHVPIAVITGYPDDLSALHGTPDSPVLVLAKPVRARQIDEVFKLTVGLRGLDSSASR